MYTQLRIYGRNIEIVDLIRPIYISTQKGSTVSDLKRGAEDYGLHALPVRRISASILRSSPYNIILHTKSDLGSDVYDHFELFVGMERGQARIFDAPSPVRLEPFHELARRWSGNGLVLSDTPIDTSLFFQPARRSLTRFIGGTLAALAILWLMFRKKGSNAVGLTRWERVFRSMAECSALVAFGALGGVTWHMLNDRGLLSEVGATSAVEKAHIGDLLPNTSARELAGLIEAGEVLIVDARLAPDYALGHIEGAVNVPVNADWALSAAIFGDLSRDHPIVIYCQSYSCNFDEKVAAKLRADGFTNLTLFEGGWMEWDEWRKDYQPS